MNYEIRISLDKALKNRNKTRYWLAQQTIKQSTAIIKIKLKDMRRIRY